MFINMSKNVTKIHIYSTFMRYMFQPHMAISRQYIIKEFTALCTLSIVFLKYVIIIITFGLTRCLFFLSFVLWLLCTQLGVPRPWSCICVDLCSLCDTSMQQDAKIQYYATISCLTSEHISAQPSNVSVLSMCPSK
jgi:hypothetical protein